MTQELFWLIVATGLALFSRWVFIRNKNDVEMFFALSLASGILSLVIFVILGFAYANTLPVAWPSAWSSK